MGLTCLPQGTVRLLASSQVITTVSSVVKELMENSFDAGASNIEVRLEKHGLDKIEVKDDGSGIVAEDCLCMALPHYTNKIAEFSDLETVQSYGFRGEALYSLCTIASVSVTTRTADDEVARTYVFDHSGKVVESKISHGLKGTIVAVTELFKNVPVRRTIMSTGRRVGDELKKVETIVKSLAVIHPRARVTLAHNKFLIWQKTSVSHLKLSVMQILNHTITRQLYHLVNNSEQIKIDMVIPKKDCDIQIVSTGSVVDTFRLFINKRPVRDKKIEKIFSDVFFSYFGHYMPHNKFPVCFVALNVPPKMLDVNLEPNKTKIFIKDQDDILEHLKELLRQYYCNSSEENTDGENYLNNQKKRKAEASPSKAACKARKSPLKTDQNKELVGGPVTNDSQKTVFEKKLIFDSNDLVSDKFTDELNGKSIVNNPEIVSGHSDVMIGNLYEENVLNKSGSDDSLLRESSESITMSLDSTVTNHCHSASSGSEQLCNSPETNVQVNSESLPMSQDSDLLEPMISKKNDFNEEISLSQWSRGNIMINEKTIQGSSVLVNSSSAVIGGSRQNNSSTNDNSARNEIRENFNMTGSSSSTTNFDDELDKYFDSEEGNLLLERVTSIEKLNNKPESCILVSEKNISVAVEEQKQTIPFNVKKTSFNNDFSNRNAKNGEKVNNNDSLNRSVSSQMGKKEMSAFTKFAREMRSEILKESPGMSFTLVASTLAAKWRNLQAEEKERYEKISSDEKDKKKEPINPPSKSSPSKKPKSIPRPSVCLTVDMNFDLEKYLKRVPNNCEREDSVDIVGQIESSDFWMYCRMSNDNQTEIGVLSYTRLNEAYRFYQNMEMLSIPVKNLENGIHFAESDLETDLWNVLMNLEFNIDGKTKSFCDPRIVKNGFRISVIEDERREVALLTDVAMNINFYGLEDLRLTLENIRKYGKDCTIAQSRCLNAIKFIRSETIREISSLSEVALPGKSDVLKMINQWWNECQHYKKCPHEKDVILPLQNI